MAAEMFARLGRLADYDGADSPPPGLDEVGGVARARGAAGCATTTARRRSRSWRRREIRSPVSRGAREGVIGRAGSQAAAAMLVRKRRRREEGEGGGREGGGSSGRPPPLLGAEEIGGCSGSTRRARAALRGDPMGRTACGPRAEGGQHRRGGQWPRRPRCRRRRHRWPRRHWRWSWRAAASSAAAAAELSKPNVSELLGSPSRTSSSRCRTSRPPLRRTSQTPTLALSRPASSTSM